MNSTTHTTRRSGRPERSIDWHDRSELSVDFQTDVGVIKVRHGRFAGGPGDGVEVVTIDNGVTSVWVLPTRGMGLWQIVHGGLRFGWDSPIAGPVHPDRVPVWDPSGLGWLEGFDELLVRCGLESNGAPQFDPSGRLEFPLHGHIANTPAASLEVNFDPESRRVELVGMVAESRLFFKRLHLHSRVAMVAGRPEVEIADDVTNAAATPATMQLLYHINLGSPILTGGSTIEANIQSIRGRDDLSQSEIERWSVCDDPRTGYQERVYLARSADQIADGSSGPAGYARLRHPGGASMTVRYRSDTLPFLNIWKNTADTRDGYVVGLEPATGHPMTRREEAAAGRLVHLDPGQSEAFRLTLIPDVKN